MTRRARGEGNISYHKRLKLWQAKVPTDQVTAKGKRRYAYAYGKTKEEAASKRADMQKQVRENTMPEPHRMTVSDLLKAYLEHKEARVQPRTHELYEIDIERFINPRLGGVPITKLTPLQIEKMQSDIHRKTGNRAARSARATLARALKQAVRWRLIFYNPADGVDPLKPNRKEMQIWEPDEVKHFLSVARDDELYPLFYLAVTAGIRVGELLALRWSDVVLSGPRPSITVRGSVSRTRGKVTLGDTKTAKAMRRLALSDDQVDVMQAHHATQDLERVNVGDTWQPLNLVFPSQIGSILTPSNLYGRHWIPLRTSSGCTPIRFHDLRHTYASLAIRAGMDVRLLADRLGHTDPAFTLRVYAHVFDEYRQSGAISLDHLLTGKLEKVA